ncbi:NUDIX hydrolase [Candidatus Amoebophilus asiaticus]|uniref:NUDIX hydrolase n=1 Tax=Candidatus Amoebophilus asiaticus TaxID=281120 RepID=UPI000171500D|nr:NUDIX domain-containing protein [Candidatus Amoebophilus asiaticus]
MVVKLREAGKWDIPAGKRKPLPGELASKTAERETWEEAGIRFQMEAGDSICSYLT